MQERSNRIDFKKHSTDPDPDNLKKDLTLSNILRILRYVKKGKNKGFKNETQVSTRNIKH